MRPDIPTETLALAGLESEAEIVVDRWGVPHLTAGSRRDLFFLQGFNAARDRLWQLDIWRKRGLGRLAADFGPGYLAQDRAARLFLYRGDMDAEWSAYGVPDLREVVTSFVRGINAFIDLLEDDPARLPPEFATMGTRPARWEAEDVIRIRSHALVHNVLSEALRAQVLAKADRETDLARRSIDPPHDIAMPEGFDPAVITPRVLDDFLLATAPVTFSPERLAATLDEAPRWNRVNALGEVLAAAATEGSNNWAVAPSRTATGRAILATDPHRTYALPSLRYVVHMTAPGMDLIGTGEPALPGISFGHNGHSAFAMTIFPADQEDLYVYEADPDDAGRYRYGSGWEAFRTVEETIPVKGAPDQTASLRFTRHGPVIWESADRRTTVAVRTVWSEPGTSAYLASIAGMEAKSPEAYQKAMGRWGAPGANHVYADVDGNVAWFVACKVPKRPNWDGLLPVPGDGRFEWAGFHDPDDLPRSVNPERGWVATANQNNLPPDYPAEERKLGFEFLEPARANRIFEVLGQDDAHSIEAAMALQTDTLSLPARRVLGVLPPLAEADMLAGWNGRIEQDSPAAALFEIWWTFHLKPELLSLAASGRPDVAALLVPGDHETLLEALEHPGRHVWLPDAAARDACFAKTLSAALADCRRRLGDDPSGWRWGRLHHGHFEHSLRRASGSAALRDVGPLPKGGSNSTVMMSRYRPNDLRAVAGASFRAVIDVGNWDASRFINSPGQSGDPASSHYGDLAEDWAAGRYHPLVYSRSAVEEAAERRIVLTPGPKTQ